MLPLTYRQILKALQELSEDQLDMSATICDCETKETYCIYNTFIVSELPADVQDELDLEDEQPLFTVNVDS